MTVSIDNATAIEMCDTAVDNIDVGAGTAQLVIYDGTPPANVDTALSSNNVLAELSMSNPAFGAAVDATPGATATANAITSDSSANASGDPSFYRILDRDGTPRIQGLVRGSGEADNGEELVLSTATITSGATVSITSLTHTQPEV